MRNNRVNVNEIEYENTETSCSERRENRDNRENRENRDNRENRNIEERYPHRERRQRRSGLEEEDTIIVGSPTLKPIPNVIAHVGAPLASIHPIVVDNSGRQQVLNNGVFTRPRDVNQVIVHPSASEVPTSIATLDCEDVRPENNYYRGESSVIERNLRELINSPRLRRDVTTPSSFDLENAFNYNNEEDDESTTTSTSQYLYELLYPRRRYLPSLGYYAPCILFLIYTFAAGIDGNSFFSGISPSNELLRFRVMASYPECNDLRSEVWRLISYSIVHKGLWHVFSNCIGFLVTMTMLEVQYCRIIPCSIYLLSLAQSAMVTAIAFPDVVLVGCSGGVFGLLGAVSSNFIMNHSVFPSDSNGLHAIIIFIFLLSELLSYFLFYEINTAYIGHWSGYFYGLSLGFFLLEVEEERNRSNVYYYIVKAVGVSGFTFITSYTLVQYSQHFPLENHYNIDVHKYPRMGCCSLSFNYDGSRKNEFTCS